MIKAQELRIGNLVYDNLGGLLKIKGISTDSTLSHLKPIQLTEEWLLKFGYLKLLKNIYSIKGHNIWICNDLIICDKNGIILKFVHQLQNLYFALNGEELTIKEANNEQ